MTPRTRAIAKKEFKQLSRDKRMLFVIFFFPVLLLIVFGYAVNFDVQNIQLAVNDNDRSELSREFVNTLSSSSYFEIVKYITHTNEINSVLDQKEAQVILVIPNAFTRDIYRGKEKVDLQFLIDGVDGNTATIIQNYVNAAALSFSQKINAALLTKYGITPFIPIDLHPIFWFNPDLQTTKFLLPGLIAFILIVTAVITVSLSLVREKEKGTIEQLNVSSLNTIELLLGKSFPYLLISFINAVFILIAGYILFGIEVKGSYLLLFFSIIIFLFACTSIGVFISVVADSLQVAFSAATFFSLLPSVILSGFIFPIESMPWIIQVITNITPTKFFIIILRAIILRGVGLHTFWLEWIYLLLFGILFLILASIVNKIITERT